MQVARLPHGVRRNKRCDNGIELNAEKQTINAGKIMYPLKVEIRVGERQSLKVKIVLREKVAIVDALDQPTEKIAGTLLKLQNLC